MTPEGFQVEEFTCRSPSALQPLRSTSLQLKRLSKLFPELTRRVYA
jgi:hypothetical protein